MSRALVPLPAQSADTPWPTRDWPRGEPPPGFAEPPFPDAGATHALVVIWRGRLVYERYGPEHGPDSDGSVTGLNLSPDGKSLLVDVDFSGPAAIYAFDLNTEKATRVTSTKDVAFESCWLTKDEFLCVIFKEKEKHGNMRSVYRIATDDKIAKLVIKDAKNPSVSEP